ncbi:MAG: glutamate-cysteine ligase family protein [Planctomycetota bacterium]
MTAQPLSLFAGYGIEIESMLVDRESFDVRPVADEVLRSAAGTDGWVEDVDDGEIGWSNELVMHLLELKTNGPAASFAGLAERFRASAGRLNRLLAAGWNARLMPSAMHPWMDPARETRIWPHEHGPVYHAFDRLFGCRRHGWANLQSVHLNLPFADDHEFGRLHAAVRLVLPLIPALAAASPVAEGRATGLLDSRLEHYRTNSTRAPFLVGDVVPEPIFAIEEYHDRVLGGIDRVLAAAGAAEVLRGQEWTNARGAIARFDRMAIEIRLIDAQECHASDLAVAAAVAGLVRFLVEEHGASYREQRAWPTAPLAASLFAAIRTGPETPFSDSRYPALFGGSAGRQRTMGELWLELAERVFAGSPDLEPSLQVILRRGTLAQRLLAALGPEFDRRRLRDVAGELCACLGEGRPFRP